MAVAMLVPLPLHTTRGASRCPAIVACDAANDAVAQGIVVRADDAVVEGETTALTKVEVEEIGNLVEDDEWLGLTTELAIVARVAIRESLKKSVREFTGNDDYKCGLANPTRTSELLHGCQAR